MRIALAQTNTTVGDIPANVRKTNEYIARAKSAGAQVVVFPELSIIGYPPKDLLLKPQFIDDNLLAVEEIARDVKGIDVIVGYADRSLAEIGRPLHNAAAVLRNGRVDSRHFKTLLPTYDVFDESRYFEPGPIAERNQIIRIGDLPVGLSICEDLWNDERLISRRLYHQNPIADLDAAGAELMINCSASPFVVGKQDFRMRLFGAQARQCAMPLVYVNQVGGNDELVFDGCSMVFDAEGNAIARAKDFEEDLLIVDLPPFASGADVPPVENRVETTASGIESIYKALVLGLRDYARKCGFKNAVLGLSGGIDSALVCAIAADALGAGNVMGVAMPSRYSSDHSIADARKLAENLGVEFHVVPIEPAHAALESMLAQPFAGRAADITEENVQARLRGNILMSFSNKFGSLLLTTGNKSEVAVGYCTLYGDMCGGLAVISDVPKTVVWEMSRWINQSTGRDVIPRSSIDKAPSAELKPNQTDQDSLPPYEILDAIIFRLIEEDKSVGEIIVEGYDAKTVLRVTKLIDRSEYKRRQAAPGLKVTSRAFGFGRRMPIAQNYQQLAP
ncbi:MAG: NAD+ synthase [Burkholderiales bacterium]|nr:NAD+ synthase [Phycisphaerae bacterium]